MALGKPTLQSSTESGWVSDKAVDGIIGADVESNGGGSCSSTRPSWYDEAWWMVDLEQIARNSRRNSSGSIRTIPFDFPDFIFMLQIRAGWKIYKIQAIYVTMTTRGIRIYRQSTNLVLVIIKEAVAMYLRIGCPVNHFGPACSNICHCGVGGCDPDAGLCDVNGCQSGWKGTACSEKCEIGEFGVDCRHTCHCSSPGCDRFIGSCTVPGCEAGWQGNNVDLARLVWTVSTRAIVPRPDVTKLPEIVQCQDVQQDGKGIPVIRNVNLARLAWTVATRVIVPNPDVIDLSEAVKCQDVRQDGKGMPVIKNVDLARLVWTVSKRVIVPHPDVIKLPEVVQCQDVQQDGKGIPVIRNVDLAPLAWTVATRVTVPNPDVTERPVAVPCQDVRQDGKGMPVIWVR
ncbi:Tyrosine-protein kinase receptor Tie-1 [Mizuhopecten yessoensis]|uniref:Tyrosine-protein kinase receptor Tie-1 n=1 Tax=Mizuhopecten yessoensis TaxID=6573 RepID=A0A210QI61_MIZYE|nr:Tyrosine-protein kinase receptor Tie-1 [Mizuhopecten yessoensis]